MNIKPLEDRVLVKIEKTEKKSEGGIFLPGASSDSDPVYGKVVAIGNGRMSSEGKSIPMTVEVNSVVLLYKHSGTKIKIEGEEYVLVREGDLLAIVD